MGRSALVARRFLAAVLLVAGMVLGLGGVAAAQYVNPPPPGGSGSDRVVATPPAGQSTQRVQGTQRGGSSLPITGGDVVGLIVLGTGTVALGAVFVGLRRRSERS